MKLSPKLILGIAALLLLFLAIYILKPKSQNTITLWASENKFKINFLISDRDRANFQELLENLKLPKSTLDGIEFELDSTSSAKLDFASPVLANLKFEKGNIAFSGKTTATLIRQTAQIDPNFKVPPSTSFVLFGKYLWPLLENKFNLPADFKSWLRENVNSTPQYLLIFGQNPDVALAFRKKEVDFGKLQFLDISKTDQANYKQETQDNINFHLLKIPQADDQTVTFTFFELGQWSFITTSFDAAQEIVFVQNDASSQIKPFEQAEESTSLAFFFQNYDQKSASYALSFFLGDEQKVSKLVEKIKEGDFFLKEKEFSGRINFSH